MDIDEMKKMQLHNEESARESMLMLGYAPNPHCEACYGFGRIHPLKYDGKPDYSQSVMCQELGCLSESYNRKGLI